MPVIVVTIRKRFKPCLRNNSAVSDCLSSFGLIQLVFTKYGSVRETIDFVCVNTRYHVDCDQVLQLSRPSYWDCFKQYALLLSMVRINLSKQLPVLKDEFTAKRLRVKIGARRKKKCLGGDRTDPLSHGPALDVFVLNMNVAFVMNKLRYNDKPKRQPKLVTER